MEDKTDKEIYLGLARLSEQSLEKRKDVEWKVGFGFWTAIGIFTWFTAQHLECISSGFLVLLAFIYLVAAAVWTVFWQMPLHNAHSQDRDWKHYYAAKAEGLETPGRPRTTAPTEEQPGLWGGLMENVCTNWKRSFIQPWLWGQTLITVVFLVISLVFISAARCSRERVQEGVDRLSGQNVRLLLEKIPDARRSDIMNLPNDKSVPTGITRGEP